MKTATILCIALVFLYFASLTAAVDIQFSTSGTQYYNLTINYRQVRDFSLNVTGKQSSSSYPSNITIDFANDGTVDWAYKAYMSQTIATASKLYNLWSNDHATPTLYLQTGIDIDEPGITLGTITAGEYLPNSDTNLGSVGITTISSIGQQIVSIITNTSTIHAFLPEATPTGKAMFYIAQGGASYYCNSDHNFFLTNRCDLTVAEALTPAHLARSPISEFNFSEIVKSQGIIDGINKKLSSCTLPCKVPLKITSSTAGTVKLSDLVVIGPEKAAKISVQEFSTYYHVTVSPNMTLTSTSYSYFSRPTVYIVPFVAANDNTKLDSAQKLRLSIISSTIAAKWDNLTNSSQPMNFTFFLSPKKINGFDLGGSFANFSLNAEQTFLTGTTVKAPGILVILDIHDYFPTHEPYNTKTTLDSRGLISTIYLNGLTDSNSITSLYRYNEEILPNVLLHELAHSFLTYPEDAKLFYGGHPASFSTLTDFDTFAPAESPTGSEGYFELYSIMNQLRPYLLDSQMGKVPTLSPLDRMLLGTLSPDTISNYTFYQGHISKSADRYLVGTMSATYSEDAGGLYNLATDKNWWDARGNSTINSEGVSESFNIQKSGQAGRAFAVFALDAGHPDNFQVFNDNAGSVQSNVGILGQNIPEASLVSPADGSTVTDSNITLSCSFATDSNLKLKNMSLYTDTSGSWKKYSTLTFSTKKTAYNASFNLVNLSLGTYKWNCLVYDNQSQKAWGATNATFSRIAIPFCGDGSCNNAETCKSCQADCGSCSGGSGGGGGGGSSTKSTSWPIVTPGEYQLKITDKTFPLTSLIFTSTVNAHTVKIVVTKLNGRPTLTPPIEGIVYKYVEISLTNLESDNLSGAKIRFNVSVSWITKNNLTAEDIALFRYVEPQWVELPTAVLKAGKESTEYESNSPGFSYFAVVGRKVAKKIGQQPEIREEAPETNQTIVPANQTENHAPVFENKISFPEENSNATKEAPPQNRLKNPVFLSTMAVFIICSIGLIILRTKYSQSKVS